MRKIDALLIEYGESHQNPTNKRVHWICVPVIFWCVVALIYAIPPVAGVNLLWPVAIAALVYYALLSVPLAIGFAIVLGICWALIQLALAASPLPLWATALVLFVLAWIGQFWGHKVEGKKPSFFKDVQFLLIGPAWLLSFLYRRAGLAY
ncbi:DUF962 domain-containing protein [Maritimibacter sp. DP1N21-5]|uniref:Mpo1 family 2-hydroxy fatty acid dioxygenase n=1 Tax=Maritimibacter sp. DP1N21-5 TaxID=2836867 RepID=UPI001C460EA9|nr:Mpo1-like protein [Maritimibacter sp. DP1N21-5]MBV7408794.1 DUF962 domain-containing protein [Maritimibacter sp. DP1N21-5]